MISIRGILDSSLYSTQKEICLLWLVWIRMGCHLMLIQCQCQELPNILLLSRAVPPKDQVEVVYLKHRRNQKGRAIENLKRNWERRDRLRRAHHLKRRILLSCLKKRSKYPTKTRNKLKILWMPWFILGS